MRTPNINKYYARRTEYNGEIYDSKAEAHRAFELDMLLRAGEVTKVDTQPIFRIEINGEKVCKYIADFRVTYPDGHIEYEDVKGFKTPLYRLKKKLVKALFQVEIKEI